MANRTDPLSIPQYFEGQTILITGGTGLMGKVLVEKMLRSCPLVTKLYLLMRAKKGKSIQERWCQLTQLPLFDRLKTERPDALSKIELVPGDLSQEDICPSSYYKKVLRENVTMVYHAAAMVQFTDSISDALAQNVRGTFQLLEIAKNMSKLKVFVYISTAYSNFDKPCSQAEERVHPTCQDWRVVLKLLQQDPMSLNLLKEKLLCGHPNPYTWSKSIAEQTVKDYHGVFPVVILRPALVSCTVEEPFPCWNDGSNVCFAFGAAIGLGALHVARVARDQHQDLIPVDVAIKALLIAPWKLDMMNEKDREVKVYNCATANDLEITYGDMKDMVDDVSEAFPSQHILWSSFCFFTTSSLLHNILFLFLQILPASFLDLILVLLNRKPMLSKMNKKLINGYRLSEKIMCNKVTFPNEKFKELPLFLRGKDKEEFGYDLEISMTKKKLILMQAEAFFKYHLKEQISDENKAKNRKRYQKIRLIHNSVMYAGLFLSSYYLIIKATSFITI